MIFHPLIFSSSFFPDNPYSIFLYLFFFISIIHFYIFVLTLLYPLLTFQPHFFSLPFSFNSVCSLGITFIFSLPLFFPAKKKIQYIKLVQNCEIGHYEGGGGTEKKWVDKKGFYTRHRLYLCFSGNLFHQFHPYEITNGKLNKLEHTRKTVNGSEVIGKCWEGQKTRM